MKSGLKLKEILIEYQEKWFDRTIKLHEETTRLGQAGCPHKGKGFASPTVFSFAILKAKVAHTFCGPF